MKQSIIKGDCIKLMKSIKEGLADLVFADPPFNIGFKYDIYNDDRAPEEYLAWTSQWMEQVKRILKPDGSFWLAIGDAYVSELDCLAKKIGFFRRSWVVWYYTFGQNNSIGFTSSHTHLLYYTNHPKNFNFYPDAIKVPSARQLIYNDKRAVPTGRLPDNTWLLRPQNIEDRGGFPPDHDVWHIPRVAGTFKEREGFHGCQMPEAILARILASSSKQNDLVIDPFCGSGTTIVVAKKMDRKCITFDISDDYVAHSRERLANCKGQDTIDGGNGFYATK